MIKTNHLEKEYRFGDKSEKVLKKVSIEFKSGNINVIYGPSGCGKSTLLNIISGLDTDYEGEVQVNNKNLKSIDIDTYRKDGIGFIFQSFNLIGNLSALENVMVPLKLKDIKKKAQIKLAEEKLEQLGMLEYKNKKPSELSGGQKQRVAIARALVTEPEIIVADEPTGALDSKTAAEVIKIIQELASKKNKTVIIVTHDDGLAQIGDQIIRLKDGEVQSIEENKDKNNKLSNSEIRYSKNKFTFSKAINNAFKNLKSNILRTSLISLATSIGLIGILVAQSLGNGVSIELDKVFGRFKPGLIVAGANTLGGGRPSNSILLDEEIQKINSEFKKYNIQKIEEIKNLNFLNVDVYKNKIEQNKQDKKLKPSELAMVGRSNFDATYKYDKIMEQLNDFEPIATIKNQNNSNIYIFITDNEAKNLLNSDELTNEQANSLLDKQVELEYISNNKKLTVPTKVGGVIKSNPLSNKQFISSNVLDFITNETGQKNFTTAINAYAESDKKANEIVSEIKKDEIGKNYSFRSLQDIIGQIGQVTSIISIVLSLIAAIALIVAAFMISIMLFTSIFERTREIGTYRAIGYKKSNIRAIFITEAALISFLGLLIALITSKIIELVGNLIAKNIYNIEPLALSGRDVLIGSIIVLIITMVSGILPAVKAGKLDPSKAISYE